MNDLKESLVHDGTYESHWHEVVVRTIETIGKEADEAMKNKEIMYAAALLRAWRVLSDQLTVDK